MAAAGGRSCSEQAASASAQVCRNLIPDSSTRCEGGVFSLSWKKDATELEQDHSSLASKPTNHSCIAGFLFSEFPLQEKQALVSVIDFSFLGHHLSLDVMNCLFRCLSFFADCKGSPG